MSPIEKSSKLDNVCYDIRGPVLKEAKRLEEEGNKVLKLNIGNPAPFGFDAPDEILVDVIRNLPTSQGYSDSKGLYSARKAIMQHYQARGMRDVTVEDIYIGNGVSELIVQAMQALLNSGDEMLVPAPDYPLWTAAVALSSGKAGDNVAPATARRANVSESSSRMHHLLQKISFKNISFLNNSFIHFLNFLLLRHQRQNQAITLK